MKRKIFISYSHKDEDWLKTIKPFIDFLSSKFRIHFWSDERISPGENWKAEIRKAIETSDIALLLVSMNFISSGFISKNELPPILEASEKRGLIVLSLLLSPSLFDDVEEISRFQALNHNKVLSGLTTHEQAEVLTEVSRKIARIIEKKKEEGIMPANHENVVDEQLEDRKPLQNIKHPINFSDNRTLIFDIDGTLLNQGENLSDSGHTETMELLRFFIQEKNFKIIFITGNDYKLQERRVLFPIIKDELASSTICFSDGGTRLFKYSTSSNQYVEDKNFSDENRISDSQIKIIEKVFHDVWSEFIEEDNHKELFFPDIKEHKRKLKQNGDIEYLDIIIYPIRSSIYNKKFHDLIKVIEKQLDAIENLRSVYQILDKTWITNSVVIRLFGKYASKDANDIKSRLFGCFAVPGEFNRSSQPEIEKRGSYRVDNGKEEFFTSQIAVKPFKINAYRIKFLELLKEEITLEFGENPFSINLGGKTTIDIQLKNVNKANSILHLIGEEMLNPDLMIYFGDEFRTNGNDLPIALLDEINRPKRIIHVGKNDGIPQALLINRDLFFDFNGPNGTVNYLRFLRKELCI